MWTETLVDLNPYEAVRVKKRCYGLCDRCVWRDNGGCSEWNGLEVTAMAEYQDAVNGDIYLNPFFGDMWIVENGYFIKINDGFSTELNDPIGFIKVGHVDGVKSRYVKEGDC